jgi:hypothetical protein
MQVQWKEFPNNRYREVDRSVNDTLSKEHPLDISFMYGRCKNIFESSFVFRQEIVIEPTTFNAYTERGWVLSTSDGVRNSDPPISEDLTKNSGDVDILKIVL